MTDAFDDVQRVGRDSFNRAFESFSALSRSWQSLATESVGFSKQAIEEGAAHVQKLMSAKSVDVAMQAHTEYLRSAYDHAAGQLARIGDLYLGAVRDAAKPFEGAAPIAKK
jgi:hypothetical protein